MSPASNGGIVPCGEHKWVLIAEEPITVWGRGYVRNWGEDYPVEFQTGRRRRFYCSCCRETSEDVEKFEQKVRLTA